MQILAHRGIWGEQIEPNSIDALREALSRGFSLETDIRLSADGEVIIVHDDFVLLELGKKEKVDQLVYWEEVDNNAEFKRLVPTLKEVLDLIENELDQGQVVAFHVKDYLNKELIEKACIQIEKKGMGGRCFLFDVPLDYLEDTKSSFPDIPLSVSIGERNYIPIVYTLDQVQPLVEFVDIIWADEWEGELYTKAFIDGCKVGGKRVYAISPELHTNHGHPLANTPQSTWRDLISYSVDGVCTDLPEQLVQFYESESTKSN